MKRSTKLILIVAVLGCLGGSGVVLSKIQRTAGVPFPGAVVMLDDDSWRSRTAGNEMDSGYVWTNSNAILYKHKVEDKYQVIRRQILPNGTVSPPETLPIVLKKGEEIASLSPDGTTLCVLEVSPDSRHSYQLVRTEGKEKPVRFRADHFPCLWSPDSHSLYGMPSPNPTHLIERINARTGVSNKTTFSAKREVTLDSVAPGGNLLDFNFDYTPQANPRFCQWEKTEVQGKQVVTSKYQRPLTLTYLAPYFSPDGKRILWYLTEEESSLLEKVQGKLFRKPLVPHKLMRWQVTDFDGKNERWVGSASADSQTTGDLDPAWTPDSKGIHFLEKGKLMYLAVP